MDKVMHVCAYAHPLAWLFVGGSLRVKGWKWRSEKASPASEGAEWGGYWEKTAVYCFINRGMLASSGQGFTFDPKKSDYGAEVFVYQTATVLIEVCVCPCVLTKCYYKFYTFKTFSKVLHVPCSFFVLCPLVCIWLMWCYLWLKLVSSVCLVWPASFSAALPLVAIGYVGWLYVQLLFLYLLWIDTLNFCVQSARRALIQYSQ